jgi:acetyl-CoA C-acetyltransferase
MLFEAWTQLRGEAGARQIASVAAGKRKALTHNLGGSPGACVSFVSVVGDQPDA